MTRPSARQRSTALGSALPVASSTTLKMRVTGWPQASSAVQPVSRSATGLR